MTYANAKEALLKITEKSPGTNNIKSEVQDMVRVKEEPLDYENQPTMYNETEFGVHNTFYGYDSEQKEVYYKN